jgi:hypothetical protein
MFFSGRDWETSQDRGKEEWSILDENLLLLNFRIRFVT